MVHQLAIACKKYKGIVITDKHRNIINDENDTTHDGNADDPTGVHVDPTGVHVNPTGVHVDPTGVRDDVHDDITEEIH